MISRLSSYFRQDRLQQGPQGSVTEHHVGQLGERGTRWRRPSPAGAATARMCNHPAPSAVDRQDGAVTGARDQPEPTSGDDGRPQRGDGPVPAPAAGGRQGERRWPMATAVVSVGVLQELVPDDFRVLPRLVYPILLLCFLGVLVLGDPGRIDRQRRWLRVTTLLMFGLITLATAIGCGPTGRRDLHRCQVHRRRRTADHRGVHLADQCDRVRLVVLGS